MLFKIFVSYFMLKLVSGSMHSRTEGEVHCYSRLNISDPQHKQFSTKTAYAAIKGTLAKVDYEVKGIHICHSSFTQSTIFKVIID